jgi:hypothetical protein
MADVAQPVDPLVWVKRLYGEIVGRRRIITKAANYYDGAHNLAFASEKFLEAFGGLFRAFSDNWCGVVVDAVEERLNVTGFRVPEPSGGAKADSDAKRIWEDNELDLQAQLAHTDALVQGASYVTVWYRDDSSAAPPEITVDSAVGTVVAYHPKFRRRRMAALRSYCGDDGYERAELFLPGDVYVFRSRSKSSDSVDPLRRQWQPDTTLGNVDIDGRMPNPLGVVPVVELLNRPRLFRGPKVGWGAHSEIASVMPLQDAVNKLVADLLTASEFAAYPQRWLTGYEPDTDPETNAVRQPDFKAGAGRLWWLENPDSQFGQFTAADLSNFVKAVDMVIQHVASISRTPPHYLNASADRLSGESIKAAETGLVAKVRRRQGQFGAGWEEVMRIAGQIADTPLGKATSLETIWADPESRTEAEHVDATLKKQALGVPQRQLWEDLGYTPEQIERFEAMRLDEALLSPPPLQAAPGTIPGLQGQPLPPGEPVSPKTGFPVVKQVPSG